MSDFETCPVGTMARLRELERMAVPAGVPVQFLCNNTRFKMSFFEDEDGGSYVTCFESFANELDGRWVALVAAEDGSHMKLVAPAAANQAPHHQADIAVLLDMIDTLCNGIAWNIENHPDVMNQSDDEALAAGRALVERYRSSAAEACQSQTANGEKQPDLSAAGEKQDVAGLVAEIEGAMTLYGDDCFRREAAHVKATSRAIASALIGQLAAIAKPQQEAPTTEDVRELSKWLNEEVAAPINRQALARVLASVQQPQQRGELPSEVQIEAGARAICKRHAAHWNNTPDEDWAAYSYDHRADAKACLVAALAASQKGAA